MWTYHLTLPVIRSMHGALVGLDEGHGFDIPAAQTCRAALERVAALSRGAPAAALEVVLISPVRRHSGIMIFQWVLAEQTGYK